MNYKCILRRLSLILVFLVVYSFPTPSVCGLSLVTFSGWYVGQVGKGAFQQIDMIDVRRSTGTIACADHSGIISLWNAHDATLITSIADTAEIGAPALLQFWGDSDTLISVRNSGFVRLWATSTHSQVYKSYVASYITDANASINSHRLWIYDFEGHNIYPLRDTLTLLFRIKGDKYGQDCATFTPDGQAILIASDRTATLWDIKTSMQLHRYDIPFQVQCMAYKPDGNAFATGAYSGQVDLWDALTGEKIIAVAKMDRSFHSMYEVGKRISCLDFSPSGKFIAAGRGDNVEVWEIANGRLVASFGGQKWITGARFLDDRTIVISGQDILKIVTFSI